MEGGGGAPMCTFPFLTHDPGDRCWCRKMDVPEGLHLREPLVYKCKWGFVYMQEGCHGLSYKDVSPSVCLYSLFCIMQCV